MKSCAKATFSFIFLAICSSTLCAQETTPRPAPSPLSPDSKQLEVPPNSPSSPTSPGAAIFKPTFPLLDIDHDGELSRDEIASVPDLAKDFDRYDLNRDGKLDRSEFERYAK